MSNFSTFFPAAAAAATSGGGGGIPKYQEFTSSGTFTPTQALIDAGGRVSLFMVGGGAGGKDAGSWYVGGTGGEVIFKLDTLTSTSAITITIGAGGNSSAGGNSIFAGSSAGGTDITSYGGPYSNSQTNFIDDRLSSGAGAASSGGEFFAAQNGTFGYGAGGAGYYQPGVFNPKVNSGQGGYYGGVGASGFIRVTWFE